MNDCVLTPTFIYTVLILNSFPICDTS